MSKPAGLAPAVYPDPFQAGQDLGDIAVSPLLEVAGEVYGTPAELAAFAAEWDQPAPMKRGSMAKSAGTMLFRSRWRRSGTATMLTFHLTGLAAGKLRIVSRFRQGGKPISRRLHALP